jgi:hypothetical protein
MVGFVALLLLHCETPFKGLGQEGFIPLDFFGFKFTEA